MQPLVSSLSVTTKLTYQVFCKIEDTSKLPDVSSRKNFCCLAEEWLPLCRSVFENAIDMAHIHYLHNDTFGNQVLPATQPRNLT